MPNIKGEPWNQCWQRGSWRAGTSAWVSAPCVCSHMPGDEHEPPLANGVDSHREELEAKGEEWGQDGTHWASLHLSLHLTVMTSESDGCCFSPTFQSWAASSLPSSNLSPHRKAELQINQVDSVQTTTVGVLMGQQDRRFEIRAVLTTVACKLSGYGREWQVRRLYPVGQTCFQQLQNRRPRKVNMGS